MSGLIDQAGLTAGAGLSNGAGLYKYANFNPFDPTDLDPYLLFDTAAGSMIGTLENPTLDLDPTNQETLDVITATRAGTATITDQDGNIATVQANTVRVDYTQGEQLTPTKYQHIENTDFSNWSHARTSGTANAAISPDGQNNATYVVQNAGQTNAGSIYRFDAAFTGVFTLSVYAKKKEKDFVVLYDSNTNRTYFNLDTGTVGTVPSGNTANIEDAGNGWFRCSTTFTASSGGVKAFYVGDNDNSLTVTDGGGIYVWGPQLEEGTTASSFVANTTGSPKFITGATFGPRVPMILVEPSSENLVPNSSSFSALSGATLISNIDAPDGSDDAKRISNAQAVNTTFAKSSTISIPTGVSADYVGSVYVRGTAGDTVSVFMKRQSGGTFVTSGSRSVLLTGDWQRVENLALTSDPTNSNLAIYASSAGKTADSIDLWGSQIEAGSVSTSVIPTSGSTAQRAADDLVISGSAFTDFFNGSEGTIYVEVIDKTPTENSVYVSGQSLNQSFLYSNVDLAVDSYDGANFQRISGVVANELFRAAATYDSTSKKISLNGTTYADGAHNGNWGTATILNIGWGGSGNAGYPQINGHIKRLIYWPTHSDSL